MHDTPLSDIRIGQISHHWAQAQKLKSHFFESTDSTNLRAKEQAFSDAAFNEQLILYFADQQTRGKGRGKNSWITPLRGSQLLSTWSFMIEQPLHPTVSAMIGLAVYRAANSTWPFLSWNLKAPNDLYINEKKIAGLLLETISQGQDHRLLIGLGLNVTSFPESIANACSLVSCLSRETPLLAQDWISFLERLLFEFSFSLQLSIEEMNSTSCAALTKALNDNPLLSEKYISVDSQANLLTANSKISWLDL